MRAMYIEQVSQPSFFSRLDVRTKLLFLFFVITIILVWENIFYQMVIFFVVLTLTLSSHLDPGQIRKTFLLMAPFIVLSVVVQGFFNIRGITPLITLFTIPDWVPILNGPITFFWEGLVFGLMVVFRLLSPVLVLPLVVMTTDINELVLGLVKLRVPYKIAYVFSVALRFVPFIFGEIDAITEAQRLRGLELEKMNIFQRVPVFASLAVPLILGSLFKAQTLDVVLQAKAFRGTADRTYIDEINLRPIDYILITGMIVIFFGALFGRLTLGWGGFIS